jgi:high affinity Mn2+ porin
MKSFLLAAMIGGILLIQVPLTGQEIDELDDLAASQPTSTPASKPANSEQIWNFHVQNTDVVQGYPAFSAQYSGPNSLSPGGQVRESVSLDVYAGLRLWSGAEVHVDGLLWQGYGLDDTEGIEDFPNAVGSKAGTEDPEFSFTRLFIRQTIGLGGDQEDVADDPLDLAGKRDISRVTLTIGRFSPTDIFDTNTYANDPTTQFMGWGFVSNLAWDYPADANGFTTGVSAELNQPHWTLRYGFFQMPSVSNSWTAEDAGTLTYPAQSPASDGEFWKSWGMPAELELRYGIGQHPGAIRFMAWLNEAHMGNYQEALLEPGLNIALTREYRFKYGFGINWEQEIASAVGVFSRLGWNDGREEAWTYTDVAWSASLGIRVTGDSWYRPNDTIGLGGIISGVSAEAQEYLEAGGTGILDGDGALNYGWERVVETYYDWNIWRAIHFALDYQYVDNPAFNRDRGPVSIFAARVHWQF